MCGHQNPDVNPITYGDMDYELLERIRAQIEPGVVVSFHRDGEPTAYPRLSGALRLFSKFTTSLVTHGLNLHARAGEIIGHCTSLTVSAYRGDPDVAAQLQAIKGFLALKGSRSPQVQIKIVGDISPEDLAPYEALGVRIIRRLIHVPISNSKYAHRNPAIPETGVCLDALHRPTIDWTGRVYLCNRLDPEGNLYIGDIRTQTLDGIWNGPKRQNMIEAHKIGRRDLANPLCETCLHWGTPSA